jgi:predicted alpha/beta-hydrolase family hydrolase
VRPRAVAFAAAGARSRALVYGGGAGERAAGGRAAVLAPGAGAGQTHPFMTALARALAGRGIAVVTFDFLYRAAGKKAPDRNDKLEACWRAALEVARAATGCARPFVGGKSMGGRIASQLCAAGEAVAGLVLLGYPLHPPRQPEKLRVAHLAAIAVPTLILQGARDPFGAPDELRAHFPSRAEIVTMPGGHSFDERAWPTAHERVAQFILAQ